MCIYVDIYLGYNKYFILFIDDLTGMTWVVSLISSFQGAEGQSDCTLKALRSDNGGEYTSNDFN